MSAQTWAQRNAAALALVDRLPISCQAHASINDGEVFAYCAKPEEIAAFVAEHAPDSPIKFGEPLASGQQRCEVKFADGAKLLWFRKVKVVITVDEE